MKRRYVEPLPKRYFVAYDPEDDEAGLFKVRIDRPMRWYEGFNRKRFYLMSWVTEDGEEPYGPCISTELLSKLQAMDKAEAYKVLYRFEADLGGANIEDFEMFETSVDAEETAFALTFRGQLVCSDLDLYDWNLWTVCDDLDKVELAVIYAYEVGFDLRGVKA